MFDSYLLALSCADYLSSKEKYDLFKAFNSARSLFESSYNEIRETRIINDIKIRHLLDGPCCTPEISQLKSSGVKTSSLEDSDYPERLRNIYAPPVLLYYFGELPGNNCVSIVGSRKTSPEGRLNSFELAFELAKRGFCIVSGMARGIDSCAHLGALKAGKTTAVLGSGIDICYPPENKMLMDMIIEKGCVISEYPPGRKPDRLTFPSRNRIISGMSEALVVVEAAERSGALITADFAIEQGREVFAFDYAECSNSKGTKALIQEGAFPVIDVKSFINTVC